MMRMKASRRKVILIIFLFAAFSLSVYGPALAANESTTGHVQENLHEGEHPGAPEGAHGEGHGGGDRSADLRDLLYRFINFALLVIILLWALDLPKSSAHRLLSALTRRGLLERNERGQYCPGIGLVQDQSLVLTNYGYK